MGREKSWSGKIQIQQEWLSFFFASEISALLFLFFSPGQKRDLSVTVAEYDKVIEII
jgi:hypothetical protein